MASGGIDKGKGAPLVASGPPQPTTFAPVSTIEQVIDELHRINTLFPAGDGIACFNQLYLAMTEGVSAELSDSSYHDPAFMHRLDVIFANLYFSALQKFFHDPAQTPRAWYPLFSGRSRTDVHPLQMALAGMNAHINRDLMVALVTTCEDRGVAPEDGSPQHLDYLSINDLIAREENKVKQQFLTGVIAKIDKVFHGLDDVIANWDIVEARASAWRHAQTLWALRHSPTLSEAFIDTIDGIVGFAGRGLLVPTA